MSAISTGGSTAGKANVDAGFNLNVALTNTPSFVGSVRLQSENDAGALTGSPFLRSPETSSDYRLRTGFDTPLFVDQFNATTQNTNNWNYVFATMTASQPGAGTLNFGTVQGTAATHGAFMRSSQYWPMSNTAPLCFEFFVGQFTAALVANETWFMGLGTPVAAGTQPTDGVWFNLTTAGLFGELRFNGGTAVQTTQLRTLAQLVVGEINKFTIVVSEREIQFWLNDEYLGELVIPVGNGTPSIATELPMFMQKICTGVVSNTNTMRVARVGVSILDCDTGLSAAHIQSLAGGHAAIGQDGHAQGNTGLNVLNAAVPTTAAIANATVGATFIGLGGYFVATAQATNVAAAGDMIACSYQNPAPTVNITGRNLIITGVRIAAMNTGAVVATTPTALIWGVAWGHTAASLATAETASFATATTRAPRRLMLGCMIAQIGAVIGQPYDRDIAVKFDSPLVVRPGEFIAITVRFRIGTATAAQEVTYLVSYDGYWL